MCVCTVDRSPGQLMSWCRRYDAGGQRCQRQQIPGFQLLGRWRLPLSKAERIEKFRFSFVASQIEPGRRPTTVPCPAGCFEEGASTRTMEPGSSFPPPQVSSLASCGAGHRAVSASAYQISPAADPLIPTVRFRSSLVSLLLHASCPVRCS